MKRPGGPGSLPPPTSSPGSFHHPGITLPTSLSSSGSKRDLEEARKKQDELAAAEAFEEYVAVFQDTGGTGSGSKGGAAANKVWIKAGTYDAGRRHEDTKDKGKLYKPTSRFEKDGFGGGPAGSTACSTDSTQCQASSSTSSPSVVAPGSSYGGDSRCDKLGSLKKKQAEKKKSNLEIFKEELKIIQEEREERHRLKRMLGLQEVIKLPPKPGDDLRASLSLELDDVRMGSIDDGDPNTTNIYLGNLPTKISEQQLMEVFGKYGPLASVKVMWPRTEEEKARNRLSGFVAFMSRRDGERALKHLTGKEVLGAEIKLGWGKAVPIPAYPVYIPPAMLEMTMPPPLSGMPFNGQVDRRDKHKLPPPGTAYPSDPKGKEDFERLIHNSIVKVVMPTDRALLALIHRMVEFVIREGPMFEAMIMNKEIVNPQFRFLFENQSPAHVYYRWKLYSLLQGDSTSRWRIDEFRMFRTGSVWRPPKLNPFTQGMPDELIPEEEREIRIGSLSNAQRTRLERMLRRITPDRHRVAEVMIFSIEHSESTDEICGCLRESLTNQRTSLEKKIARLYVINDVLHNCTAKGMNAFGYRKAFKCHLPAIFNELHYSYKVANAPMGGDGNAGASVKNGSTTTAASDKENTNAESFKQRVMGCFKAWDEWGVYSNEFLIKLQNIFLGLATFKDSPPHHRHGAFGSSAGPNAAGNHDDDPAMATDDDEQQQHHPHRHSSPNHDPSYSSDEETARTNLTVHRQKLHKKSAPPRAQLPPQSAMKLVRSLQSSAEPEINEEIDGVPMIDPPGNPGFIDTFTNNNSNPGTTAHLQSKFKPSKWEELDPEEVKAQAVTTTSKWDLFEEQRRADEEAAASAAALAAAAAASVAAQKQQHDAEAAASRTGDLGFHHRHGIGEDSKSTRLVGYGNERDLEDRDDDDDEDIDGMPMDEDDDDDDDDDDYNDDGEEGASNSDRVPRPGGYNVVSSSSAASSQPSTRQHHHEEEDRRSKLREVEMKVLAFQDELERRGVVSTTGGVDLVREYREKLLRKVFSSAGGSSMSGGVPSEHQSGVSSSSSSSAQYEKRTRRRSGGGNRDRDRDRDDNEDEYNSRDSCSTRRSSSSRRRRSRSRSPHHRHHRHRSRHKRSSPTPSSSTRRGSSDHHHHGATRRRRSTDNSSPPDDGY